MSQELKHKPLGMMDWEVLFPDFIKEDEKEQYADLVGRLGAVYGEFDVPGHYFGSALLLSLLFHWRTHYREGETASKEYFIEYMTDAVDSAWPMMEGHEVKTN